MLQWVLRAVIGVVLCGLIAACDQDTSQAVDRVSEDTVESDASSGAVQSASSTTVEEAFDEDVMGVTEPDDETGQQTASENILSEGNEEPLAAPNFEMPEAPPVLDLTIPRELRDIDAAYSQGEEPSLLPDLFDSATRADQKTKISGELILNDTAPEQPLTDRLGGAKVDVKVPIR